MKTRTVTFWLGAALFVSGFCITSCNKQFTPPEVVGVWNIGAVIKGNRIKSMADFSSETYDHLYANGLIDYQQRLNLPQEFAYLEEVIETAFQAINTFLEDHQVIRINEDHTFNITSASFFQNAAGTYTQDGSYLFFTCTTGHFPETNGSFMGGTDGYMMEIYPSTLILTPIFLSYLSAEESTFLFGTDTPLIGVEGIIFYTRSGSN